jgi:hypothetical protein
MVRRQAGLKFGVRFGERYAVYLKSAGNQYAPGATAAAALY